MDAPPTPPATTLDGPNGLGMRVEPEISGEPASDQNPPPPPFHPPIANNLLRLLETPPKRQANGYYVRTDVGPWCSEIEVEIVSSLLVTANKITHYTRI